ncbi:MAG TPA: PDZ domain-containing protein [Candidatus Binatia bacterium]|nr:PDZ domain-containing protein [Candidatus Binatia bacterium]
MADTRRLIVLMTLLATAPAYAAGPCDEGRAQTGVAAAVAADGGLAVQTVDPDSPAAEAGIVGGDRILQLNAAVPRTCAEWARAVRDARRERKAMLILVERGGRDVPLAVAAAAWQRAVATAAVPAAEPPTVRHLVASPPPPLPESATVTLDEVTGGLGKLAATSDGPNARVDTYRHDLVAVERQIETLAARRAVPPDVLEGLRTVAGYYEAAGVAWGSEESERERRGQPRHIPFREGATVPYFEDSDVAETIERFPFLRDAVVREPQSGRVGESAGAWRPRQARALLWEHGRDELAKLTAWLSARQQ